MSLQTPRIEPTPAPAPPPVPWTPGTPLFIAGPTAVGKSALAMALAEMFSGEIVSVDSMQVYRGLDIGTAKPTASERARIPHHLIDVVDLSEAFDAAAFCRLARTAVDGIQSKGRTPIFCGGTGLYFKAWMEGLGEAPPKDDTLRAALNQRALPDLLEELKQRDPETFEVIDRNNPRRVVRALEVTLLTGKPFSAQRAPWQTLPSNPSGRSDFLYLCREPHDLAQRIQSRVGQMFDAGWIEETRRLRDCGLASNPTAMQAIGYRQILEFLDGKMDMPSLREEVAIKTRQYAKRQGTWFRRQTTASRFAIAEAESMDSILQRIRQHLGLAAGAAR